MINTKDILQTIQMIDQQHLDIRTITMGISLLDCCDADPKKACQKIYDKITDMYKRIRGGFLCLVVIAIRVIYHL